MKEGITQGSPWEHLKGQCLLGSEQFISALKRPLQKQKDFAEIPKQQRRFNRPSLDKLFGTQDSLSKTRRNKVIHQAIMDHGYTQSELSDYLKLHYSTISRLFKAEMSK